MHFQSWRICRADEGIFRCQQAEGDEEVEDHEGAGHSYVTRSFISGWMKEMRCACKQSGGSAASCVCVSPSCPFARYACSPQMGQPRCQRCTRIWLVRPVSGWAAT